VGLPRRCSHGHSVGIGPFTGFAQESQPTPAPSPAPQEPEEEIFGQYTPGAGFRVAKTELGELNIRVFTYIRYLNQSGLDPTYTNAFGDTSNVQQREDLQLNKVQITTFGWILSPKLRYVAYVWSSNTSLGQLSQVVVAGT
jgi:hypothetical protein